MVAPVAMGDAATDAVSTAAALLAVGGALGFGLSLVRGRRPPDRWLDRLLIAGVVGFVGRAVTAAAARDWLIAALLGAAAALVWMRWEDRRAERGRRVWLLALATRVAMWRLARRPRRMDRIADRDRRPGQGLSLTEIQTEYAQSVLHDAARDPNLAEILEEISRTLLAAVRELEADLGEPATQTERVLRRYVLLTTLANSYLASVTEPGARVGASPYRGYSYPMLTLAAACQLGTGDRLRTG